MSRTGTQPAQDGIRQQDSRAVHGLTAVSMMFGRGAAARTVAGLAGLTGDDRVVDVGCGPGTAVREAARHAAAATGVDPDAASLALARWISARRRARNVTWLEGRAEHLPLPDDCATVVWALSSVHHWPDRITGFAEAHRVLADGGRLLIAERLVRAGARGHAAHGLTPAQAGQVAEEMAAAGFSGIRTRTSRARRRVLIIIEARRGPAGEAGPAGRLAGKLPVTDAS